MKEKVCEERRMFRGEDRMRGRKKRENKKEERKKEKRRDTEGEKERRGKEKKGKTGFVLIDSTMQLFLLLFMPSASYLTIDGPHQ